MPLPGFIVEPLKVMEQLVEVLGTDDSDAGLAARRWVANSLSEALQSLPEAHDATSWFANSMTALFQAVPW